MTARPHMPDSSTTPIDKSTSSRRANKPLMEKRRRARINQSLAVLKALILDSAKMENTKHSKLEKADILELTVRHLQRQKTLNSSSVDKYRAGFIECAREVTRFLDSPELQGPKGGLEASVRQRLMRHLEATAAEISLDFTDSRVEPLKGIDEETERRLEALEEFLVEGCGTSTSCGSLCGGGGGGELEARPDSSTTPGDENNNSNCSTGLGAVMAGIKRKRKRRPADTTSGLQPLPPAAASTAPPPPSTSAASSPVPPPATPAVSLVQVIPSRLPDGQVVFLLPSHYVQLPKEEEKEKSQEMPIDFSVKKIEGDKEEEEVWRPW